MKKHIRKFCAATTVAAILLSASPIATPIAHAGIDWGGVIGGVLGGVLGGGGSSGGSRGGGNGGGTIGGLSNQQHAHPNPNDHEKLFMLAVEKNDIGTVSEMLNAGVDINGVYPGSTPPIYSQGRTAFSTALQFDYRDMMQFLLENGADVNGFYVYDNRHISYLELVTESSMDIDLAQFLLDWGADVNGYTNKDNSVKVLPIDRCVIHHRMYQDTTCAMAQLLINHGTSLENKDAQGFTPFLKAIDMRSERLMNVLADGGANINAKDKRGRSALQIALDMNDLQLYKEVQDIMARGQQPSQYQPSKPQTQRRTSESGGNASGDDDLISFENNTDPKSRSQELSNFSDSIIKAMRAEKKANETVDKYMNDHPGTLSISDRSTLSKNYIDAVKKIKDSLEPQTVLNKLNHLSFDEKETCSDLLQIMNTRYDKLIDSYSILALNRDLTIEEMEKTKGLLEETSALWKSAVDVMGRVDKFPR